MVVAETKAADSSITRRESKVPRLANILLASPIRLLLVPYAVGVVWHGLHPIASVLTGDMNHARGWYIDENSLDPNYFQVYGQYDLIWPTTTNDDPTTNDPTDASKTITSLCHGIEIQQQEGLVIPCIRHTTAGRPFEIAKIVPLSAGISPVSEAIVLVVPPWVPCATAARRVVVEAPATGSSAPNPETSRAQFQASILQLMRRLASPQTTPWLAKTILVVSPVIRNSTDTAAAGKRPHSTSTSVSAVLEETVTSFLEAYLGKLPSPLNEVRQKLNERLPMDFTGAVLRNLLVLDMELWSSNDRRIPADTNYAAQAFRPERSELRILPQGRRGLLPNMDLTFLVKVIFDRANMCHSQYQPVDVVVHPYHRQIQMWWSRLKEKGLPVWFESMLHLLSFEYVMAVGPYPPHAPALERGIDALTIQGRFQSATNDNDLDQQDRGNRVRSNLLQQYPMELVQRMELIFRSLSNLHERLHHSTALYLLPSKDRFVKHEEYLVPNLLLIVPLLIRAIFIAFRNDRSFRPDLAAAGQALVITMAWTNVAAGLVTMGTADDRAAVGDYSMARLMAVFRNYQILLVYLLLVLILALLHKRTSLHLENLYARESIQFAACLVTAFIHISIAFGHVSLAYPSALLWTPLLAFPTFREDRKVSQKRACRIRYALSLGIKVGLFVASSPFAFLVPCVFPMYTPYVRYAYIPMHFLCGILHIVPDMIITK